MATDQIPSPEEIRQWRERMGWNKKTAAERLGITPQYLWQIETGARRPSRTLAILMACLAASPSSQPEPTGR